jgi:hypothetical protein
MKVMMQKVLFLGVLCLAGTYVMGQTQPGARVEDIFNEISPAIDNGDMKQAIEIIGDRINAQDAADNNLLMVLITSRFCAPNYLSHIKVPTK